MASESFDRHLEASGSLSQNSGFGCQIYQKKDPCDISRRSIDWRDSGCVIEDDDDQFNSFDGSDYTRSLTTSFPQSEPNCCRWAFGPDDDGDTILHLAVVGCTQDKVKDLIKICDLDAINDMMQTPLHVATMANRPEMVHLLIESRARLNVHDRRGCTPLHLACQKGYIEIAEIILEAVKNGLTNDGLTLKQHLEMTDFDGQTCIHLAALNNKREILKLLVNKYDANLNCQDSRSGDTIMHKAISKFDVDLVEFILNLDQRQHCNGADYSGRRPLDTIRKLENSRIDSSQIDKLFSISNLICNQIRDCIEHQGCCAQLIQENGKQSVEEILAPSSSSSSSSSCGSDSDSDVELGGES